MSKMRVKNLAVIFVAALWLLPAAIALVFVLVESGTIDIGKSRGSAYDYVKESHKDSEKDHFVFTNIPVDTSNDSK